MDRGAVLFRSLLLSDWIMSFLYLSLPCTSLIVSFFLGFYVCCVFGFFPFLDYFLLYCLDVSFIDKIVSYIKKNVHIFTSTRLSNKLKQTFRLKMKMTLQSKSNQKQLNEIMY